MQELPHVYKAGALALSAGHVFLSAADKQDIESLPPREFGGPGTAWSPEELLVAAVADCFVLSFKAIAHASTYEWDSLECHTEGTLEQLEGSYQFTGFRTVANLKIGPMGSIERAERLMHKADKMCLVTNSLRAPSTLETRVTIVDPS
jgi:organic hydroperoxide reductase OsmC/OhrA